LGDHTTASREPLSAASRLWAEQEMEKFSVIIEINNTMSRERRVYIKMAWGAHSLESVFLQSE
jgi:hypothetical protein